MMRDAEDQFESRRPEGESSSVLEAPNRRRPSVASFSFESDPRNLRNLLAEVDSCLGHSDPGLRRSVRLLVGEIVARLMAACPGITVRLAMEIMADSVRLDIAERSDHPCEFWNALDHVVFSDLTSRWGRDRRGGGGAWFEVEIGSKARPGIDREL